MLYSGTDPESYITEYTSVFEGYTVLPLRQAGWLPILNLT